MVSRDMPRGSRRVRIARLRTRFGDKCWLCGLPMSFVKTPGGTPLQASVDHVIPVPHGGRNRNNMGGMLDNLRLAHRECNSLRHDKPVTAELKRGLRMRIEKLCIESKGESAGSLLDHEVKKRCE